MNDLFYFHNWRGISPPTVENIRVPSIIHIFKDYEVLNIDRLSELKELSHQTMKNMRKM